MACLLVASHNEAGVDRMVPKCQCTSPHPYKQADSGKLSELFPFSHGNLKCCSLHLAHKAEVTRLLPLSLSMSNFLQSNLLGFLHWECLLCSPSLNWLSCFLLFSQFKISSFPGSWLTLILPCLKITSYCLYSSDASWDFCAVPQTS